MTVTIQPGARFEYDKAKPLFDTAPFYMNNFSANYDVSPDGNRFLMMKRILAGSDNQQSIVVVSHWLDEVKAPVQGHYEPPLATRSAPARAIPN